MNIMLCFKIGWYFTFIILGIMTIGFSTQLLYLCLFKKMKFEIAAEIIIEKVTKFFEQLKKISKEMQKSQLKMVNPEIEVYLQYYEMKIKSWLQKYGLV